jgi:hypothetical protein
MDILSFEFHTFEVHQNNVIVVLHREQSKMFLYHEFHLVLYIEQNDIGRRSFYQLILLTNAKMKRIFFHLFC